MSDKDKNLIRIKTLKERKGPRINFEFGGGEPPQHFNCRCGPGGPDEDRLRRYCRADAEASFHFHNRANEIQHEQEETKAMPGVKHWDQARGIWHIIDPHPDCPSHGNNILFDAEGIPARCLDCERPLRPHWANRWAQRYGCPPDQPPE